MNDSRPIFREGPPRVFIPVSSRNASGFTFHGPIGYEEITASDAGECPIEPKREEEQP